MHKMGDNKVSRKFCFLSYASHFCVQHNISNLLRQNKKPSNFITHNKGRWECSKAVKIARCLHQKGVYARDSKRKSAKSSSFL